MPAKARWLLRVPHILETLRAVETAWLDRECIERIFDLRRRRAVQLLHVFGGFQAGKTFLVERERVVRRLEAILEGEEFRWEKQRRVRLSDALTEARRYSQAAQVTIATGPEPAAPALPAGVRIEPGRVVVEFSNVEDLLAKFYAVAQAAAGDFAAFHDAVTRAAPPDILQHK